MTTRSRDESTAVDVSGEDRCALRSNPSRDATASAVAGAERPAPMNPAERIRVRWRRASGSAADSTAAA